LFSNFSNRRFSSPIRHPPNLSNLFFFFLFQVCLPVTSSLSFRHSFLQHSHFIPIYILIMVTIWGDLNLLYISWFIFMSQ
jgi:hypothetical protein